MEGVEVSREARALKLLLSVKDLLGYLGGLHGLGLWCQLDDLMKPSRYKPCFLLGAR